MLARRKRTDPSPASTFTPPVWKLYNSFWLVQFIGIGPGTVPSSGLQPPTVISVPGLAHAPVPPLPSWAPIIHFWFWPASSPSRMVLDDPSVMSVTLRSALRARTPMNDGSDGGNGNPTVAG